jgi:hypothetical protein
MPEAEPNERLSSNSGVSEFSGDSLCAEFSNEWVDAFDNPTQSPADSKPTTKKYIRRVILFITHFLLMLLLIIFLLIARIETSQ